MAELLALDVVRDPVSELGGRLDRFAGDLSARLGDFGALERPKSPSLLRDVSDRWTLHTAGVGLIEVFDSQDFGGLMRHWGDRAGYENSTFDVDSPFVIPVDPVEHVQGLTGRQMQRRPDRDRAFRPVATRTRRPTVRPAARERWRPAPAAADGGAQFSAYPPAMGRAGAIDATMLRFPTATAQVADGPDRAVVTDALGAARSWSSVASLAPAASAAEQLSDAVGAHLAPAAATPVDAWLVPATTVPAARAAAHRTVAARPGRRLDARVPLTAFAPRIGPTPLTIGPPEPSAKRAAPRFAGDAVGTLITPIEPAPVDPDLGRQNARDERARATRSTPEPTLIVPEPTLTAPEPTLTAPEPTLTAPEPTLTAPEPRLRAADPRLLAESTETSADAPAQGTAASPRTLADVTAPGETRSTSPTRPASFGASTRSLAAGRPTQRTPWRGLQSAPPGRSVFVPAALARLARPLGEAVRPSEAAAAEWPWAVPPRSRAFDFARRADDGVLIQAVAAEATAATPTDTGGPAPSGPTPSTARGAPARPPGPVDSARSRVSSEPTPVGPIAASLPIADPVQAGLDLLLGQTDDPRLEQAVQRAIATSPGLIDAIIRQDRQRSRATIALSGRGEIAPPPEPNVGTGRAQAGSRAARVRPQSIFDDIAERQVIDGLSVLSGAPASAALFAQAWQTAPPMIRAVLGAAGIGPDESARPGPAFSFGERLAAVATSLSAQHGLTTAGQPAGALDAPWFSEPTGTLVLPMTPEADAPPAAIRTQQGARQERHGADRAAVVTTPGAAAPQRSTVARSAARPAASRTAAVAPQALRAALRGARRLAHAESIATGPTVRAVPSLPNVTAPIAPEALSLLTAVQSAPPALVQILARAESLLSTGEAPERAVSLLARAADLPALVTLARIADAPDAVSALTDPGQAPAVLRALQRAVAIESEAERRTLRVPAAPEARFVEPVADPPAEPAAQAIRAPTRPAETPRRAAPAISPDRDVAQVLAALTNAVPAAVRAALAATARTPGAATRAPVADTRVSVATGRALDPTTATTTAAPLVGPTAARSAAPARPGIGAMARRLVEWSQTAEAAAPSRFDALALSSGDAQQSPIAQRIITPGWGRTLDATLLSADRRLEGVQRATPIGRIGRRSAALTGRIDGLGPAAVVRPSGARPAGDASLVSPVRAAWRPPTERFQLAAAPAELHAEARLAGPRPMSPLGDAPNTFVAPPATPEAPAAAVGGRRSTASAAASPADTTPRRSSVAPGLPGGRFRWPRVALAWVESVAGSEPTPASAPEVAAPRSSIGAASRPAPGARSLDSLALSSRILVKGLDGLGLLDQSTTPAARPGPLGPLATTAPTMQLELGLPGGDDVPTLVTERFADRTLARQVPPTERAAQVAPAPRSTRFDLDVDWVQPLQAVDQADAQLAPRLRSPGNIRRAIGVWVDAVKAEAERSPSAARQALGSVGQLIDQFSAPSSASPTVRPSNVLRGSIFEGSATPVMIESPDAGEARPTLIRPGEHAAKQALRKGNNETMQVSGGAQTVEDSRHKNAEQTDELMPPEEVERIVQEVIDRVKRQLEFDRARTGGDEWD